MPAKRREDSGAREAKERPEFPKPLVRLKSEAGGYGCEVRMVGDAEDESSAKEGGWQTLEIPAQPADFVEYPKWQYHADGRRQIVYTEAEGDALDGFEDAPVEQEGDAPTAQGVPPPVAQATALSLKNRPPVPADRG